MKKKLEEKLYIKKKGTCPVRCTRKLNRPSYSRHVDK